jgi:hypothetical protein
LVLFLLPFSALADNLYTRDLNCEQQPATRAKEICLALEGALAWRWTGHAIISPGFRMGFDGIRQVYCALPITHHDTQLLVDMDYASYSGSGVRQALINNGAGWLLSLLGKQAIEHFPDIDKIADKRRRSRAAYLKKIISLELEETSSSIFNPLNKSYILNEGCP